MAGAFDKPGVGLNFQIDPRLQDFLWAMTGIPMAQQGFADVQGAFGPDGAATDIPIGAAKMGLAALPVGGPVARAALATGPRIMATLGGLGGLSAMTSESEAASRKRDAGRAATGRAAMRVEPQAAPAAQAASEPQAAYDSPSGSEASSRNPAASRNQAAGAAQAASLYDLAARRDPRIALLVEEQKRLRATIGTEVAGRGGYGSRAQAAEAKLAEVNEQLKAAVEPYLPFDQRFPTANKYWTGVQIAAPMAIALATRGAGRAILNAPKHGLNRSVRQAEGALDAGKVGLADRKIAESSARATGMSGKPIEAGGNFLTDTILPVAAGTGLGAELSLLPEQYNRRSTLPGTPEHDLAEEKLKPENWLSTAAPGMVLGALGGFSMGHMPGGTTRANVEGATALEKMAGPDVGGAYGHLMRGLQEQRNLEALRGMPLPKKFHVKQLPPQPGAASAPAKPLSDPLPVTAPAAPARATAAERRAAALADVDPKAGVDYLKKDRGKSKTRWFEKAITRFEGDPNPKAAMTAIEAITPEKGFTAAAAKRRQAVFKDIMTANPGATGPEIAARIRAYIANQKKNGQIYSAAIGAGLGADYVLRPEAYEEIE